MQWIGLVISLLFAACMVHAGSREFDSKLNDLIVQADQYRVSGNLHEAEKTIRKILAADNLSAQPRTQSLANGLLGYVYFQQQRYQKARALLEAELSRAEQHDWTELIALFGNYLGHYFAGQHQYQLAQNHYQKGLQAAQAGDDRVMTVQIKLNLARLADQLEHDESAWNWLSEATRELTAIPSTVTEKTSLDLQAAYQLLKLKPLKTFDNNARIKLIYELLTDAVKLSAQHSDQRGESLAHGYLAQLYASQKRFTDALTLTENALQLARTIDAREMLLQWEWQQGLYLKATGQLEAALSAYRRAVEYIQTVREDIPVTYQHGRSSFRDTLEPVYLELADLLLQKAAKLDAQKSRQYLLEARTTVELIKKTELEDYFQNRCDIVTQPQINLERIAPGTATVYPVMLEDRLELLIGIGNQIYRRGAAIDQHSVKQTAKTWAKLLRRKRTAHKQYAQKLYQWLIAPLADVLAAHTIDTLVIVPDSELRLIPFAALFDGQQFLIERYAVVTSPGLTLHDSRPIQHTEVTTLIAGLSQPGPVVKKLPMPKLQALVSSVVRGVDIENIDQKNRDISNLFDLRGQDTSRTALLTPEKIQTLLNNPDILGRTRRVLALPGVEQEVRQLSKLFSSTQLLNEHFVSQRLNDEILKSPYQIVHIASHGFFGHSSQDSFIMAYDQVLTMEQLDRILHSEKFADAPIELLTLSACQTAEGDDRSPLGLSGVALKANVRSVLGSLWPVSDQATVDLMQAFYQRLGSRQLTKAQALQQAQLTLLRERKRSHPFYWSPFILIGNWL